VRILRRLSAALTAAVVIVSLSGAASEPFAGYDDKRLTTFTAEVVAPGGGTGMLQLVGSTRLTTTVNGPELTLRVTKPGERVYVTFPATAGQALTVTGRSEDAVPEWDIDLTVREPGGRILGAIEEPDHASSASSRDFTAPATGTYSLELTSGDDTVGTMNVFVTSPAEPKSVTVNAPDTQLTFQKPGERALLAFPATAGRRLSVVARAAGMADVRLLALGVRGPDGRPEAVQAEEGRTSWTAAAFVPHRSGTHVVTVDPEGWATGRVDVAVLEAATAAGSAGGPAVELNLDRPGRIGVVTFPAESGQHLTALVTATGIAPEGEHTDVTVRSPHHSVIGSTSLGAGARGEFGEASFTTELSGAHTIEIVPGGQLTDNLVTGRYSVKVVGSSMFTATVGGPAVTARTPAPGGRAFVRFDVTAGQWLDVVVRTDRANSGTASFGLIAPDGAALNTSSFTAIGDENGETLTFTPPAAGTYLLEIDPYDDRAGSVSVQITEH
jgi:hypothetical protein